MESQKAEFENLVDDIKDYINTSAELYKLKATRQGAEVASVVIINMIVILLASLVLLFASVAAAFLVSELTGKTYIGFILVAGFYAIVVTIVMVTKDRWLKGLFTDNIIRTLYNN